MIQTIAFILITTISAFIAFRKFNEIAKAIQLGKSETVFGPVAQRWKNMVLFALGQGKMFTKPIAGIFHLFIYIAFIITQIELLEIFTDGIFHTHRYFANKLGPFYTLIINTIEVLSLLAFVATIVFLSRRNLLKLPRFQKDELKGWPFRDANLILFGEIILIISIFFMNGAYQQLQVIDREYYPNAGTFYLSSFTTGTFLISLDVSALAFIERCFWWLHYIVVLGFILYLPYSKHLHILLAFPTSYYANLDQKGKLENIPEVENEVRSMFELPQKQLDKPLDYFGASDVHQLSWTTLLQAFSCTECGRCTSVCPANQTGKKLSPRKIMMDIRDRSEQIVKNKVYHFDPSNGQTEITDGKSLYDIISREELYACTTCNACVEACPVGINPLKPIIELRRYDILMNSGGPQDWLPMFNSLENNQSVWAMSEPRTQWLKT